MAQEEYHGPFRSSVARARFDTDCRLAAATLACGLPIAIIGTIVFMLTGRGSTGLAWSTGYIYWPAVIAVALFSVLFVQLGGKLALRLPVGILQRIFAIILALIGISLIINP